MKIYALRCEHRTTPLGVDEPAPLLAWKLSGSGDPVAYRVECGDWDSGLVESADVAVVYAGPSLRPRTRYRWRVTVSSSDGSSETAESWFETGLDRWQAAWIAHDPSLIDVVDAPEEGERALESYGLSPCPRLRRGFEAGSGLVRARIYAAARGLYELRLNGVRVGDAELAPGWTDYRHRIQYQTYDVTSLVRQGGNALGATLADGWWSGFVGFEPRRAGAHYGDHPSLIAELHLDYADGRTEVIATDSAWRTRPGPIRYADLLMGECHDLRRDTPGWDSAGFADDGWRPASVEGHDHGLLEAACDEPVRATRELAPRSVDGAIVDFGQNFAGRVRLHARGLTPGQRITIRHAEVLHDGRLYVDNLRTAAATDMLIADGDEVVFEPCFTYHGFRYVEVTGVEDFEVTGVVLHSDTPWTGSFECSDPSITRLQRNIEWGQRSNFVAVPTDCPQRDERLGWLADAQVFLPTACFNADVAAFFEKWLRDVRDAQSPDGGFTNVAPRLAGVADEGAPGWADAGVLVPWHLYRVYGDERFLARSIDAMCAFVDHVHRHNPDLVWRNKVGPHFADWLAPCPTPREVVATAYFARSADLTARAARILNRPDAAHYESLAGQIRKTFADRFVDAEGRIEGHTQTGYLLALAFELVDPAAAVEHLVGFGTRITTGFLGVGLIAPVLDAYGHPELAHAILRRTDPPSWLYPLGHDATTIWERWDGYTDERGFQAPAMNSFNHYALGSIGEWLYRGVAGIDQTSDSAGFTDLVIRPRPGELTWARASYESVRGRISVAWSLEEEFRLSVTVPPGATATVHLPSGSTSRVGSGEHEFAERRPTPTEENKS